MTSPIQNSSPNQLQSAKPNRDVRQALKNLESIQKQIEALNALQTNNEISTLTKKLTDLLEAARRDLSLKNPNNYFEILENLEKETDEFLTALHYYEKAFQEDQSKLGDAASLALKEKRALFKSCMNRFLIFQKSTKLTLFDSLPELIRLREDHILHRDLPPLSEETLNHVAICTEKFVSPHIIHLAVGKSVESDKERSERFSKFSDLWESITLKLNMLSVLFLQLSIDSDRLFNGLEEHIQKLKKTESTVNKLLQDFHHICMDSYVNSELEEGSFEALKMKQAAFLALFTQAKIPSQVEGLKQERAKMRRSVLESLHAISQAQSEMELNFEQLLKELKDDPRFEKSFSAQKKIITKQLQKFKYGLLNEWNDSCLRLEKAFCDLNSLEKAINLELNMSLCYVNAKEICQCLRQIRKTEKSRDTQRKKFEVYKIAFQDACQHIDSQKANVRDADSKLIYNPLHADFSSLIGHTLHSLYDRTLELIDLEHQSFSGFVDPGVNSQEIVNKGLIFALERTAESDSVLIKIFNAFWSTQGRELSSYKDKIARFYNLLKPLYQKAAKELNRVSKTLCIKTLYYDDDFTKAYGYTNPVASTVELGVSTLGEWGASGISGVKNLVWTPDQHAHIQDALTQQAISEIPDHKEIFPPEFK